MKTTETKLKRAVSRVTFAISSSSAMRNFLQALEKHQHRNDSCENLNELCRQAAKQLLNTLHKVQTKDRLMVIESMFHGLFSGLNEWISRRPDSKSVLHHRRSNYEGAEKRDREISQGTKIPRKVRTAVGVDARMTRQFDLLNHAFFDGWLPPHVVRRTSRRFVWAGQYQKTSKTIVLTDALTPSEEEEMLIHEMCHAKAGPGHGPRFRAELARIASMGYNAAAQELAALDPNPFNIRGVMNSFAEYYPRRSWREVRIHVASKFGLLVRDLRRLAPWAGQEWYRLIATEGSGSSSLVTVSGRGKTSGGRHNSAVVL